MAGHKPFGALIDKMSPEARARMEAKRADLRAEMSLQDLRKAAALTQKQLAAVMEVDQPAVARMERRTDMYVSSLRRFIEAMGGELHIMARMPGGDVEITNFEALVDEPAKEDQTGELV